MKTKRLNLIHFILYRNIKVGDIDLFEDAYGLKADYQDVIETLHQLKDSQQKSLTKRLIEKIRKQD